MYAVLAREELGLFHTRRVQQASFDVDTLCAKVGREASPYLLIVDAVSAVSDADRRQLLTLTAEANLHIGRLRDGLEQADKYLIVVATSQYIGRGRHTASYHFGLETLRPHFGLLFPDASAEHFERLRRQQDSGQWVKDDKRLVQYLGELGSLEALCHELDRREQNASAPLLLVTVVEPARRCPPALQKAATWLAAYMPALPADDYRRALAVLVDGLTEPVADPPPPPAPPEPGASTQKPTAPPPLPLIERWDRDYHEIMRELGLCFWSRRADPRGGDELPAVRVLFADPREDLVKQHFEQQLVFDHFGYVKRLTDESMLFDTSEDVSAAVIRVSVDIARMRPDQVARDWLLEMIVNAGPETVGPRVVSDPIERKSPGFSWPWRRPGVSTCTRGWASSSRRCSSTPAFARWSIGSSTI